MAMVCCHFIMLQHIWCATGCVQADLTELKLSVETFGTKFDVVLIDPPWAEYVRRAPGAGPDTSWTWQDIRALEIENITAAPSFCFLWCNLLWHCDGTIAACISLPASCKLKGQCWLLAIEAAKTYTPSQLTILVAVTGLSSCICCRFAPARAQIGCCFWWI